MFKKLENWLRRLIAEEVAKVAGDLEKAHRAITASELEVLSSIEDKRVEVEKAFRATVSNFFPGIQELLDKMSTIETSTKFLADAEKKSLQRSGHPTEF
jgi:BMFP domain-containing protein YqiC